jgi:hypothetical protein
MLDGMQAAGPEKDNRYDGWCPGYWKECMRGCPDFDSSRTLFCRRRNREHPEDLAAWDAGKEVLQ